MSSMLKHVGFEAPPEGFGPPVNERSVPEFWVDSLFARMAARWGSQFADKWAGCNMALVKAEWAVSMARFSRKELADGAARMQALKFPPGLNEFEALCRPPHDPQADWQAAALGAQERRSGKHGEWPNAAVYWAHVRFGAHDILTGAYQLNRARWERLLDEAYGEMYAGGLEPIPAPPVAALPPPPKMSREESQKHAGGIKVGFSNDQLHWARRPRGPHIYPHIIEAAKRHSGVAEILRGHIASGLIKLPAEKEGV